MEQLQSRDASFEIFAGWLIDGGGAAVQRDVLMKICQGRIAALEHDVPPSRRPPQVVRLGHCTLLPALVDCHVHLCMSGSGDLELRRRQLGFRYEQAQAMITSNLARHRSHGIMALRDGGDFASHTLRFRDECPGSGRWPMFLKAAGRGWHAPGRYGRIIGRTPGAGECLAQAIGRREERPDQVKIINSGLNSLTEFGKETAPQFCFEELQAAVQVVHAQGLRAMVHANGKLPVRWAIEAGCDSIEHGFFMGRENVERMAELQVVWVPTAVTMKAYAQQLSAGSREADIARKILDHQLEQVRAASELGVAMAVGTDSGSLGVHHGRSLGEELRLMMDAGLSAVQALRCASQRGARLLGLESELGLLKPGMPATFVAIPGDPGGLPEALSAAERVYLRGKLLDQAEQELESC
jgi:imidazolonepropionase-like amidohydrolase